MKKLLRKDRAAIRGLVHQCANYDRPARLCLLLDMADKPMDCPMLAVDTAGKVCKYFRDAVLPLNPELEATLTCSEPVAKRACSVCRKEFAPKNNRQQYCGEKCKAKGKREHDREWRRRSRENQEVNVVI